MNIIYATYNINHNSIDVYTHAGYILRIDCNKAEEGLKTTPSSECALNALHQGYTPRCPPGHNVKRNIICLKLWSFLSINQ